MHYCGESWQSACICTSRIPRKREWMKKKSRKSNRAHTKPMAHICIFLPGMHQLFYSKWISERFLSVAATLCTVCLYECGRAMHEDHIKPWIVRRKVGLKIFSVFTFGKKATRSSFPHSIRSLLLLHSTEARYTHDRTSQPRFSFHENKQSTRL